MKTNKKPQIILMEEIGLILRPLGHVLNLVQVAVKYLGWRLCSTGNWRECQSEIADL